MKSVAYTDPDTGIMEDYVLSSNYNILKDDRDWWQHRANDAIKRNDIFLRRLRQCVEAMEEIHKEFPMIWLHSKCVKATIAVRSLPEWVEE